MAKHDITEVQEKRLAGVNGMLILLLGLILTVGGLALLILALVAERGLYGVIGGIAVIAGPFLMAGLTVLKPKEALVLTLFGKYYGTLIGPGFFFTNPFASAVKPAPVQTTSGNLQVQEKPGKNPESVSLKKISLKNMTLNNDKQKINDKLGNPVIIGIVVIWKVANTAKAVFNVDNYTEFLSIQCDAALRNTVRLYPYDSIGEDEITCPSLRGSSVEIAEKLKGEIQAKVEVAGLEIVEAKITNLAYAPEIAAAMLQRQQASAVVDARQMIVEGAVGMVEMALSKLGEKGIVNLDEERKAAMVSNLMVVLCGNKDAQPVVNSGSLY